MIDKQETEKTSETKLIKRRRRKGGKQLRRLSRYEYILTKTVLDSPNFELVRDFADSLGLNYLTLVRIARKLAFRKNLLGMAFSPYRAGLNRYLIVFRLKKEYERIDARELAKKLPYNNWLKSIMLTTLPMGDAYVYYLIPQGESIEPIVKALENIHLIDQSQKIFAHRMDLTYYQRPYFEIFYPEYRYKEGPLTLEESFRYISEKGLFEPDKSELKDLNPKPPPDIIDAMIMSLLEVKYIFTPKWLSLKGPFNIGVRKARYHFVRHIRDKYLLGTYIRSPLDPRADAIYTVVFRGRDALPLGYTLSRTPHAYVVCDLLDVCHVVFWIRSDDIRLINKFMEQYSIEIISQGYREILPEEKEGQIVRSLRVGFPFENYSIKGRRWYDLEESVKRLNLNILRIASKLKDSYLIRILLPPYFELLGKDPRILEKMAKKKVSKKDEDED